MTRTLKVFFLACVMAITSTAAVAGGKIYTRSNNLAVSGYDAVSYFTQDEAVKGDKQFSHEWSGVTWRFSSDENRQAFIENPEKYAPAYGGHCAYAMSNGKYVKGDPKVFKVVDGVLYLNYNKSVQKRWVKDIPGYIEKADSQWAELSAKE